MRPGEPAPAVTLEIGARLSFDGTQARASTLAPGVVARDQPQ